MNSGGIVALAEESYAAAQRPSVLAASTSFRPAGVIWPSRMSRFTCPTFIFDQRPLALRGAHFCTHDSVSDGSFCPSIQPKHGAWSSASAYVTDGTPESFL